MNTESETVQASHAEMVAKLCKPGKDILTQLTPEGCHLWHMASCVTSEGGELFDAVKRHVLYGKDMDRKNVVEELGDLEFYMQGLRAAIGVTREETLLHNMDKLYQRYHEKKFSNEQAQQRKDKQ